MKGDENNDRGGGRGGIPLKFQPLPLLLESWPRRGLYQIAHAWHRRAPILRLSPTPHGGVGGRSLPRPGPRRQYFFSPPAGMICRPTDPVRACSRWPNGQPHNVFAADDSATGDPHPHGSGPSRRSRRANTHADCPPPGAAAPRQRWRARGVHGGSRNCEPPCLGVLGPSLPELPGQASFELFSSCCAPRRFRQSTRSHGMLWTVHHGCT